MPNYFYLRDEQHSQRIIEGLERLRSQLDGLPPRDPDRTMRLATWNV